jgi:hypothetical protein
MIEAIAAQLDEQRAEIDSRWVEGARHLAALGQDSRDQLEKILDLAHPQSLLSCMRENAYLTIDVQRLAALALDELLLRAAGGRREEDRRL